MSCLPGVANVLALSGVIHPCAVVYTVQMCVYVCVCVCVCVRVCVVRERASNAQPKQVV